MDVDASVDGDGETQLFVVSGASLTLNNVQLTNGVSGYGGAAINAVSSVLVLQNTVFRGNTGRGSNGGAIHVDGCAVSFSGETVLSDNYANAGASIYITGQTSVVSWRGVSTLFNNTCGGYGCAVYADNGGRISWSGETTFELNTSLYGAGCTVNAQNAVNASWSGRVAFMRNSDFAHTGTVLALNSSTLTFVRETSFTNYTGAVLLNTSTCVWQGKTSFSSNIPINAMGGGALYSIDSNVCWSGEMHFTNNTAYSAGGALNIVGSEVSWSGKTYFTRNMANSAGDAISMSDSDMTLGGETIFSLNVALGEGGAISGDGADSVVRLVLDFFTNFDGNRLNANGGALALGGNLEVSSGANMEQTVTFMRNSATYLGGAMYLSTQGLNWTAAIFGRNTASVGRAVYSLASGTYIDVWRRFAVSYGGFSFRDNIATVSRGAVGSVAGYDVFFNTIFVNNTAGSGGGAMLTDTAEFYRYDFFMNMAYDEAPAVLSIGRLRKISNALFASNVLLCASETFLDCVQVSGVGTMGESSSVVRYVFLPYCFACITPLPSVEPGTTP